MRIASIDHRTRYDRDVVDLAPEQFFAEQLPGLLERHGHLAAAGFEALRVRPLAIEVGAFSATLSGDGPTLFAARGIHDDAVVVTLDPDQFSDWAQQIRTFDAMISLGELSWRGGGRR